MSIPPFFAGLLAILVFSYYVRWFPSFGSGTWRHLVLPGVTLGLFSTGLVMRLTRSAMLEVLSEDYIRTARAKGLSERSTLYVHALRNAAIPVVTIMGLQLGGLLAGTVLTETVFSYPGIGRLLGAQHFRARLSGRAGPDPAHFGDVRSRQSARRRRLLPHRSPDQVRMSRYKDYAFAREMRRSRITQVSAAVAVPLSLRGLGRSVAGPL